MFILTIEILINSTKKKRTLYMNDMIEVYWYLYSGLLYIMLYKEI